MSRWDGRRRRKKKPGRKKKPKPREKAKCTTLPKTKFAVCEKNVLGIDPGSTQSAFAVLATKYKCVHTPCKIDNEQVKPFLEKLLLTDPPVKNINFVILELISSYGMRVGKSIFETVRWNGRFIEMLVDIAARRPKQDLAIYGVPRYRIKQSLLGNVQPQNDAAIVGKLKHIFYAGRPIEKQALRRGTPGVGPLSEVKYDMWQALAAATAFAKEGCRWIHAVPFLITNPNWYNYETKGTGGSDSELSGTDSP